MSKYVSQSERRIQNTRYLIDENANRNPSLQEAAYAIIQYEHTFGLTDSGVPNRLINTVEISEIKKKIEEKCLLDVLEMEMFAGKANTRMFGFLMLFWCQSLLPCFVGADIQGGVNF